MMNEPTPIKGKRKPRAPKKPKPKPSLASNLDLANEQIEEYLKDPNLPMKDRISLMRILAYYKGTAGKMTDPGTASDDDVRDILNRVTGA